MTILILGNVNHEYGDIESTYDLQQTSWIPDVYIDTESIYGIRVEADTQSVFGVRVESDAEAVFSIREFIVGDVLSTYGIRVEADTQSVFGVRVESDTEGLYAIGVIHKDTESIYSLRPFIYNDAYSTYGINLHYDYGDVESIHAIRVEKDIASSYSIHGSINNDLHVVYQLATLVEYDLESSFDILTTNHIYRDIRGVYMLYSPSSETIITDVLITVNDE